MTEPTPTAPLAPPVAAGTAFDAYARLLKLLLPSLRGLCIQDGAGGRLWASADWDVQDAAALAAEAIAGAGATSGAFPAAMRTVDADLAVYAFALPCDDGRLDRVALVALAPCGSRTQARPLNYVAPLLEPLLACLSSELCLRAALGDRAVAAQPAMPDRREDAAADGPVAATLRRLAAEFDAAADRDDFEGFLDAAMRCADATLAALWVPEKRLRRSRTRSGQPLAPAALQRAEQHLLAWMQLQQRTIVVNRIARSAIATADAAPYKILASPVRHASGRVLGVLALFNPPSAADFGDAAVAACEAVAKRASAAIEAQYDTRTGLLTREAFERRSHGLFTAGAPPATHAVLHLDVDRLQSINESFGMHVGDEVIALAAEVLAAALPADALCARLSGDRLAALLPHTNEDAAIAGAGRVRAALAARAVPGMPTGAAPVSVSIGVAPVAGAEAPFAHALAAAEAACKRAKSAGGNRVEAHREFEAGDDTQRADAGLAAALRRALAEDGLRLDAQPILPLRGNYGGPRFELLLRMPVERGELLAPAKFLPLARAHGLMPAIDRWVVRRACALLGRHAAAIGEEGARFAINLAAESLLDEGFAAHVAERIGAHGVPPGALCFEITEAAAVAHPEAARGTIQALRELGCRCALDGFGAGSGALADLPDLGVDTLKIDGRIVRDALENPRAASMIKAIAQLATVMRMRTVAERVETDALRARLADLGVDYGQGFAIAKARRFEDLLEELAVFEASVSPWAPAAAATS